MGTAAVTRPVSKPAEPTRPTRSRSSRGILFYVILLLILAGLGYGGLQIVRGRTGQTSPFIGDVQTESVRRGLLRVTVNDDGNVESSSNVDLRCEVEDGSQILWIIPQGTEVKEGDLLVRFNSAPIEDEVTQQTILHERASAEFIRAETDFAVASIAVKEYEQGTFVKELQLAEANIKISQENLKSSENLLRHNERMFRKGYINRLQLETSEFAVERNRLDLSAMQTARQVLVEYTKPRMLKELESKREAAQATVLANKAAAELEKIKLDRLKEQLAKCTINAPQSGMVIYAQNEGRGSREGTATIEEGATVREMQSIIKLPDLSKMQVRSLIHETKIDKIKLGMPTTVRIRGQELAGHVTQINNQPEPGSWFSSEVKEYAVNVSIHSSERKAIIKPGMTAEVEILIREIPDALQIPLLGVAQEGSENVAYVLNGETAERRVVTLGAVATSFLEITGGLEKGEDVILNPRACVAEAKFRAEQATLKAQKDLRKRARENQSSDPQSDKPSLDRSQAKKNNSEEASPSASGGGDGSTDAAPQTTAKEPPAAPVDSDKQAKPSTASQQSGN